MKINWGNYKKLFASVLGVAALVALHYYDIRIPGLDSVVLDVIIGTASSFGVYQLANTKD